MIIFFTKNIKILDLEISINLLIYFLLGLTIILLFIYFSITFSLLKNKKNNNSWHNIVKFKQEISFNEIIEYFEQEIMIAKKIGDKN